MGAARPTMVRIGFDIAPLVRPHPRGLVRVVDELVRALEARGNVEVVRLAPEPGENLRRWRQQRLPELEREQGLAGIHCFQSAFPLAGRGKRVQTLHELPWRHGVNENAGLLHRLWAALGPMCADRVLVATEHVARDLRRRRVLPGRAKIEVCPFGVGPPFVDEPPPGTVDEVVLARMSLPSRPLVIAPGATRPKKNLAALLRGVANLNEQGGPRMQVVVTGAPTATLRADLGLASKLGLAGQISTPGEIDDGDLPALYRLSTAVAVLSHSEGFALPVLEALACGTPVIVPPASAQSEVAGPAAFLVDPSSPAEVAAALARAHAEREELRYTLSARANELTWARCAEQVEGVWEALRSRE